VSARPSSLFPAGEPLLLTPPDDVHGLRPLSLVLTEELGRPYEIELELVSTTGRIEPQLLLGRPVGIHLNRGNDEVRHFHGLVSELHFLGSSLGSRLGSRLGSSRANSGAPARYRATLRPWIWFLSRTQNCRVFQNKSALDIIKEVFRGYPRFGEDFEETPFVVEYEPRDYVVQYRESDLAFVTRLMEDAGIYYYFRQEADKHVLVLCDDAGVHPVAPGCQALPYRPLGTQSTEHEEQIDHFVTSSRVDAGTYSITHFDFERPADLLRASVFDEAAHEPAKLAVYDYPTSFDNQTQGLARTRLAVERQRCQIERCEGQSNSRSIGCGQRFAMTEHETPDFNADYLVVSQTLVVHAHDLASGSESKAELVRSGFVAQLASEPFRLARTTPRPIVMGAQTAIVSGPEGHEIWADAHGRVQVRFHWDRSLAASPTSCWIRVSQLWAGAGFGALHLPRIGQEVVVEFLDGDPDRPIIVGRVYNGRNESPFAHQTQSGIRSNTLGETRSHYNELRFDDKKGAEELYLQAERDHRVLVKHQRQVDVGDADELIVGANRTVTVGGGMQLTVGALECSAPPPAAGCLQVSATESIELRVGGSVLRIKGDRIELESAGKARVLLTEALVATAKGGVLELDGPVKLASEKGLNLEASDAVKVTGKGIQLNS